MPGQGALSGARYPLIGEANDPPADFSRLVADIDPMLVLRAASVADRDTKYGTTPAGILVVCAALKTVWLKTSNAPATWSVVAEDPPAVGNFASPGTGFTVTEQYAKFVNGWLHMRVTASWGGADIVADGTAAALPGNMADPVMVTLSAAYRPPTLQTVLWRSTGAMGAAAIEAANGQIILTSGVPSGRIRSGDAVAVTASYPKFAS